jgi:hypothetical protein
MRNLKLKLMMLTVAAWSGAVLANEYRAPLIIEHGPLRYDAYCKPDCWSFETWGIGFYRNADKAFLKHSTKAKALPSFIFGKETFAFGESFQGGTGGQISQNFFQNQNPFLSTTTITPQASYTEKGFSLGGRFEFPVWKNKGRIGLRGVIPFKSVRMERDDRGEDEIGSSLSNAVIRSDSVDMSAAAVAGVDIDSTNAATFAATAKTTNFYPISRYKLSLLTNLLRLDGGGNVQPALNLKAGTPGANQASGVYGAQYSNYSPGGVLVGALPGAVNVGATESGAIPFVVMQAPQLGLPPFSQPVAVATDVSTVAPNGTIIGVGNTAAAFIVPATGAPNNIVRFGAGTPVSVSGGALPVAAFALPPAVTINALPANGATTPGTGYVFAADTDYTNLAQQSNFNNLWVTPVFDGTTGKASTNAQGVIDLIEQQLLAYSSLGVEQFLFLNGNGFEIATNQHVGIGDLDLDLFYEHMFNESWRGEAWFGVRFPTGGSNNFGLNPFRVQEGNGNHFEIKLGANVGWATCDWLNLKAEAYYSFVLQSPETRIGAFKGATIKNIGPSVSADVDWGYFDGRLDMTCYHPCYDALSTTFGYEFYYKTKDNIRFKQTTATSFLGNVWGTAAAGAAAAAAVTIPGGANPVAGNAFIAVPMTLDNNVAAMDTEGIAHRVRGETNWRVNRHMSLFAGGAFTFAGQNIPREYDLHGGINVRF